MTYDEEEALHAQDGLNERGFQKLSVENNEEEDEEPEDAELTEEDLAQWADRKAVTRPLEVLNKDWDDRLKRDKDLTILVTGEKGEGKSTLAYHICAYDPNFTFMRNYIFTATFKTINDRLKKNVKRSRFNADEAVQAFYKMDYFKDDQNKLVKLITRARKYNQMLILCIPEPTEVRSSVRKKHIPIWIHVFERGFAMVFVRDKMPLLEDPWHSKLAERMWKKLLEKRRTGEIGEEELYSFMRSHPCYSCEFDFPDMPKEVKHEYLKCVESFEEAEETVDEDAPTGLEGSQFKRLRIAFSKLLRYCYEVVGLKQLELAEKTGYALGSINQFLKEAGITPRQKKAKAEEEELKALPPLELDE